MGKFNIQKIRGIDEILDENGTVREDFKLTDVNAKKDMTIRFIERKNIVKNEKNFYNIGDIENLAVSIEDLGLKQPIEVMRIGEDQYKVLGGERRLTAIDQLIEKGKWNREIPCVVTDLDEIKLPLSDEDKEMYSLVTTNSEQRKRTDGELLKEISILKEIYQKLKKQGIEHMTLEDGKEILLQGKTRDIVAETLGVSTGKIAEINKVEKHGSKVLMEALIEDEITSKTAAKVADMPKEEQDELITTIKEEKLKKGKPVRITQKDLSEYALNKEENPSIEFSLESWNEMTDEIRKLLSEHKIMIRSVEDIQIMNHIREIVLMLNKNL